jgi:hypothetical protein
MAITLAGEVYWFSTSESLRRIVLVFRDARDLRFALRVGEFISTRRIHRVNIDPHTMNEANRVMDRLDSAETLRDNPLHWVIDMKPMLCGLNFTDLGIPELIQGSG